ncbi:hypothetical protein GJ744_002567 [Endocarpon pusillum]|uniref:Nucleoside phosphorylase domain-containing protein n=1 Tax=Endocarpon pusillum TaxID=364733 RepID=A0A8H7AFH9_9EURO|nr:hypothetical protein GJ744_002567 [Endocarpon pusillum]
MELPPNNSYEVGWICALYEEFAAAQAMLDEEYGIIQHKDAQDFNTYAAGRVHKHNIVIACLPAGVDGTTAAATVAQNMLRTFPQIRIGLLVGIGGGIPHLKKDVDIRLGDVVVSQPDGEHGGVVQYDKGRIVTTDEDLGLGFVRKGLLNKPPALLLNALSMLRAKHEIEESQMASYLRRMMERKPKMKKTGYGFPGNDQDHLFGLRPHRLNESQADTDTNVIATKDLVEVVRPPRDTNDPEVHYGIIASGNSVIKHRGARDALRHKVGAMCVEMEAAGLMDGFPCLVIRGICDYADEFKNDAWHRYAATTAAAYAKEFLLYISPQQVHESQPAREVVDHRTHELLGEGIQLQKQAIEVQREHFQTERERHCHYAFKTSPYEEYKNNNPERVSGTCRWLLNHSQFRAWQQSSHRDLLWISADPGCGKSVLAKFLVDHEFSDADQHSACYFFFKDNERQDNLNTALCAVLYQLFDHQPSLLRHALPAWDKIRDKIQQESEEMWRIFLAAAADPSAGPIVCVLDALDECRDEDRRQLISKLCGFYQRSSPALSGARLKFLVTSRPYDTVQRWFEETTSRLPHIRLRGEDENDQIHEEINLVMDLQIDSLAAKFRLSENHQERLRQSLRQMKHRTYLWLHLAMEDIRTTYLNSPDPEEEPTNTLPKSVESAYERILQRITEKQKSQAREILLIIVGARRPLTISEMGLALNAASAHELGQSYIKEPNVQHLERHIRQWCGLFVFINHSQLFLIHQTAKEFLVTQSTNFSFVSGRWKSTFSQTEIEGEMARLCVAYLCLRQQDRRPIDEDRQGYQRANTRVAVIPSSTWEEQNKFFEYCAEHWTSHLREDVVTKDRKVLDRVLLLHKTDAEQFHAWFPIMWKALYPYESTPEVQIQHVVSMSGHTFVLNEIFHRVIFELEARDSTGRTALHWAAERGHEEVVEMLLAKGAEVNAQDGDYGNALQAASWRGDEKVVEMLLAKGTEVNAQGGEYGNALQAASWRGHEKVVEMLLAKGAEVNAQGGYYGNGLQVASEGGHKKVVEMLQRQQLLTTLRIKTLKRSLQTDSGPVSLNGDCSRKKRMMDMPAHA